MVIYINNLHKNNTFISKKTNILYMELEEKLGCLLIILFISAAFAVSVFSQSATYSGPMNVSVSLVLQISLSGNLTNGIWFTNGTQNNTQYNLTNSTYLDAWNNAIYDYPDGSNWNTSYWIQALSSNTINMTVCQCPCANLICRSGSGMCSSPTDFYNVTYNCQTGNEGGVGFRNGTNTSVSAPWPTPYAPSYGSAFQGFGLADAYTVIGAVIGPGNYTNLRYWLDPYPNSEPSGIYNATWQIRAVESLGTAAGSCGTCSC
jgi:hypothetical protein